ncbi:MAG: GGDEF domain-containing protein [Armatimonadetes bacterium]|nr:GGDEF domain-containing protein [Armatimonadota bacterium]
MGFAVLTLLLAAPAVVLIAKTLATASLSAIAAQVVFALFMLMLSFATRVSSFRQRSETVLGSSLMLFWLLLWGSTGALAAFLDSVITFVLVRRWRLLPLVSSTIYLQYFAGIIVYQALGAPLAPKILTVQVLIGALAALVTIEAFGALCQITYIAVRERISPRRALDKVAFSILPELLLFPVNILLLLVWTNFGPAPSLVLAPAIGSTLWLLLQALRYSLKGEELKALYSFEQALQTHVRREDVLWCLAERAMRAGVVPHLLAADVNESRTHLIPVQTTGFFAQHHQDVIPVSPDLSASLAEAGKSVLIGDVTEHSPGMELDPRIQSLLIVPLVSSSGIEGAILAGHETKHFFHEDHVRFLSNLANQASLALSRVALYQYLMETSLRDETTGLYNRRYFQKALDAEMKRAERYGPPFCLLTFDIDHFKRVNDTFGHLRGDLVLHDVARITLESVREGIDTTARTGGEEFHILLPATDSVQGAVIAERLRKNMENHPFQNESHPLKVTISIGLAVFPHHSRDRTELIRKADEALYEAKRGGRNRFCITPHPEPKTRVLFRLPKRAPQGLSLWDEQTGLFHEKYLAYRLREEVARPDRQDSPCSLILLSPTVSPGISAERIREMAPFIRGAIRMGIDCPSLLEGGEIAVLLPEMDKGPAIFLAERLARELSAFVPCESGTIGHRVASCPRDATTEEDLWSRLTEAHL